MSGDVEMLVYKNIDSLPRDVEAIAQGGLTEEMLQLVCKQLDLVSELFLEAYLKNCVGKEDEVEKMGLEAKEGKELDGKKGRACDY
jgi:hypothetical protein